MKKKLFLLPVIILGVALLLGASCGETKNENTTSNAEVVVEEGIEVTIDYGDGSQDDFSVDVEGETTVLVVMENLASEQGLEVEIQDESFINKIGDKVGGENDSFWMFYVNSEAAMQGIAEQTVSPGDTVEWKYEGIEM